MFVRDDVSDTGINANGRYIRRLSGGYQIISRGNIYFKSFGQHWKVIEKDGNLTLYVDDKFIFTETVSAGNGHFGVVFGEPSIVNYFDNIKLTPLIASNSNIDTDATDNTPPDTPFAPTVTAPSPYQLDISWAPVADQGDDYYYYLKSYDYKGNEDNYYNDTGLVSYWQFHESSSGSADGQTTYDEISNSNDGTIHGATWTTGKYGAALEFDGVDDYVDCGNDDSLDITDTITIEAWVKDPPLTLDDIETIIFIP